jgi:hypothetical protein
VLGVHPLLVAFAQRCVVSTEIVTGIVYEVPGVQSAPMAVQYTIVDPLVESVIVTAVELT